MLIFGGNGLLGNYLKRELARKGGQEVVSPGSRECDITDRRAVDKLFDQSLPTRVVHLAGFVDTEGCERDPQKARRVNVDGTTNIVENCDRLGIPCLFLGSDYVFDGTKDFYDEADDRNPLNVYGWTKMIGEDEVRKTERHYIVRASVIFGQGKGNLVNKIATLAQRTKLPVDKIRRPTYARDLAAALNSFWENELPYGTYHLTNDGYCSNFDLGQEILQLLGKPADLIEPVDLDQIPAVAQTAKRLIMNNTHWLSQGLPHLRPYQDSLAEYLSNDLRVIS